MGPENTLKASIISIAITIMEKEVTFLYEKS
jgi:hypothetical protein